jgi:hypothetical protein
LSHLRWLRLLKWLRWLRWLRWFHKWLQSLYQHLKILAFHKRE